MAAIRIGAGVYRDPRTGKTVQAVDQASANKLLAQQVQAKKDRRSNKRDNLNIAQSEVPTTAPEVTPEVQASVGNQIVNNAPAEVAVNLDKGMGIEGQSLDAATQYLEGYKPFNPNDVSQTGAFEDYGNRVNDAVFSKLTRNMDRDKAREREQLQQELYNRGIPLDANDKQYSAQMGALDERYDANKEAAMNNALIYGGQEASRLYGMADTTRKTNLDEFNALKDPTYTGMTGEYDLAIKKLNEERRSNKAQESNQRLAASRVGGTTTTETQSPFIT